MTNEHLTESLSDPLRHLEPQLQPEPHRSSTYSWETDAFRIIRTLLRSKNVHDDTIDQFKRCLNVLTREGYTLRKD